MPNELPREKQCYDSRRPKAMRKRFGDDASLWNVLEDFRVKANEWNDKRKTGKKRTFILRVEGRTLTIEWTSLHWSRDGKRANRFAHLFAVYDLDSAKGGLV